LAEWKVAGYRQSVEDRSGHRPRIAGITAAICALLLVAVLGSPAQARPVLVRGIGTRWSPSSVTVERRGIVKWRGVSKFHDVIAYGGNWTFHEALPVGVTAKKRFPRTGTFRFRCTYHSTLIGTTCTGMCGSVRVTP
jgi:plastocyanin